jgi:hypothetical protein
MKCLLLKEGERSLSDGRTFASSVGLELWGRVLRSIAQGSAIVRRYRKGTCKTERELEKKIKIHKLKIKKNNKNKN